MRNLTDRCLIVGGKTTWQDVPCRFTFMDSVKSEALFGAQEAKGSLMIPLYVIVPEEGKSLADYMIIMVSPFHERINQPLKIDNVKWARTHQYLVVTIPNVA